MASSCVGRSGPRAARTKDKYFKNQYHRLAGRRGKKRAIVAVGHSLFVTGYYLITRGQEL